MEKKAVFKVSEMYCTNCVMRLQSLEDDLPGVKQVDASYLKQKMTVMFDDDKVSIQQIVSAAEKLGYPTELL